MLQLPRLALRDRMSLCSSESRLNRFSFTKQDPFQLAKLLKNRNLVLNRCPIAGGCGEAFAAEEGAVEGVNIVQQALCTMVL